MVFTDTLPPDDPKKLWTDFACGNGGREEPVLMGPHSEHSMPGISLADESGGRGDINRQMFGLRNQGLGLDERRKMMRIRWTGRVRRDVAKLCRSGGPLIQSGMGHTIRSMG